MKSVMEQYSTTFISCVKDWPEDIQEDIFKLYAYLRVCDEMVEGDGMKDFKYWREVISEFYKVSDKYQFEEEWLSDFHKAMHTDLVVKEHTVSTMLDYCKGSSESVGCMMARILGCPPEADYYARCLGRAYQIINFIRDYDEDIEKGYHYISHDHDLYITLFEQNLAESTKGMHYIPEELRGPILKANKLYMDVAEEHR